MAGEREGELLGVMRQSWPHSLALDFCGDSIKLRATQLNMMRYSFACVLAVMSLALPSAAQNTYRVTVEDGVQRLECTAERGLRIFTWKIERDAVPMFRIRAAYYRVGSPSQPGELQVTSERIAFVPDRVGDSSRAFNESRNAVRLLNRGVKWEVQVTSRPAGDLYPGDAWLGTMFPECFDLVETAVNDFQGAMRRFDELVSSASTFRSPNDSSTTAPAKLVVLAKPAGVQVYVDDVFKGVTSSEGRLVIEGLVAGTHSVRLNLIGYAEATRSVELKSGEAATLTAALEPAGAKPLRIAEIEDALTGGVPKARLISLVNQYGVDFPPDERERAAPALEGCRLRPATRDRD